MSKKADNIMGDREDSDAVPSPEPPPGRVSSSDVPGDLPGPRATRFGAGPEGRAVRRERGGEGGPNFFERTSHFLHDVRQEMKRVTWPSFDEVKNTTIITLIAVIFFALYLYGVDQAIIQLGHLGAWLLSLVGLS